MRRFIQLIGCGRNRIGLLLLIAGPYLTGCGEDTSGPSADPNAQLVLLEPKGDEAYHVGDSLHVRWKAQGKGLDEITSVTVSLSPDSGTTWFNIKSNGSIGKDDTQWGNFGWKITATITVKGLDYDLRGRTKVLVRVQDYLDSANPNKRSVTPQPLSIAP